MGDNTVFKEFHTCPSCGRAIGGEKKTFFTCQSCGKALCEESRLAGFGDKHCGNCGTEIASAKKMALAGKNAVFKEFYACPSCGRAIGGEKTHFFTCQSCGAALCEESRLAGFADDYCVNCGAEIASAKKLALARRN
ncbi:MAG: hypothetical protein NC331_14030 [Lachnospiraceae bacterium]|nr:hypothetical protein [Lachnospiraceae bacterium]MCM1240483.1 hypothetical protein [Lachnospiraceae bacterium]